MKRKYFVVSDVHSFYPELKEALDGAGFDENNPQHFFVSCGDLMDRGDWTRKCLKFVNNLPADRKILIRGNHESLMEKALARGEFALHDVKNGTAKSAYDLADYGLTTFTEKDVIQSVKHNEEYNKYINSLIDYYETPNYIFVHGWIPCNRTDSNPYHTRGVNFTFDDNWREGNWYDASWICGINAYKQGIVVPNKTIICGHWHCSYAWSELVDSKKYAEFPDGEHKVIFDACEVPGAMFIDACTAYSQKVNCVVLEEEVADNG